MWGNPTQVDELMCSYIEHLWESGEPKTCANYTVAAVQYLKPQMKKQLPMAWKLISTWNKLEQPCRATPLDPSTVTSIAGGFIQWQWPRLGYLCMVGFSGFLRTGEMFKLLRKHVVLVPEAGRPSILFLEDAKTAQRNHLLWEKVLIHDKVAKLRLQELCRGLKPDEALSTVHPAKFRNLWKQLMIHLKLDQQGYTPYSLRRGRSPARWTPHKRQMEASRHSPNLFGSGDARARLPSNTLRLPPSSFARHRGLSTCPKPDRGAWREACLTSESHGRRALG